MRIGISIFGLVLAGTAPAQEPAFRPIAGTAAGYYQTKWQVQGVPLPSPTSARASSFTPDKPGGLLPVKYEEPAVIPRPKREPEKPAPLPSLLTADYKMATGPKAWFATPVVKSSVKAPPVGGAVRVTSQDGQ